ncbi:hypothetical protein X801_06796 [Opisthorchis viverrini]|uniref:Aldehyde dehydrogenase domain-containing protein n=1 Tax=Opisthorchis viverrini TaxID=6198 RepID=A0A1S8WSD8_OPIVI|nr:hypothetical protein X801_06796 [Opisthorchis viverrini]
MLMVGKGHVFCHKAALVDKAAAVAHEATMINNDQCCVACTRIFIEAPIYEKMVHKLKELAEARKVGDPFSPDTVQGPQTIVFRLQRYPLL